MIATTRVPRKLQGWLFVVKAAKVTTSLKLKANRTFCSWVKHLIPTLDRLLQSFFLHTKMISIVYSRRAEKLLIIWSSKPEYDPSATSSFSFANAATSLSAVRVLEDSLY
jgi:hypothetical protein